MRKIEIPFPDKRIFTLDGEIIHAVADYKYRNLQVVYEPSPTVNALVKGSTGSIVSDCKNIFTYAFCKTASELPSTLIGVTNVLRPENFSDYTVCGFLACVESSLEKTT